MNATVAAEAPLSFSMRLLEQDWVPDWLIRRGIRKRGVFGLIGSL